MIQAQDLEGASSLVMEDLLSDFNDGQVMNLLTKIFPPFHPTIKQAQECQKKYGSLADFIETWKPEDRAEIQLLGDVWRAMERWFPEREQVSQSIF